MLVRLAFALLALLLALPVLVLPAAAHSRSEETVPADGATVAAVDAIRVRFDQPMRVIAVSLTRDGASVAIERETGMEPVTTFEARPGARLGPGTYRVEWRGMSDDGHPMQGGFGFTVGE